MYRLHLILTRSISVAAAVIAVAATAHAALPAGSTFVQCSADGNSTFHMNSCTVGGFPGVPSASIASAELSPAPFALAEASSPPSGVFGAGTSASTFYHFQVTGGSVGDLVPVLVEARLQATGSGEALALARLIIRTSALTEPDVTEVCSDGSCEDISSFETFTVPARSGSPLDSIHLYAEARTSATKVSSEFARAIADPYLVVDPAFPNAGLYAIVVSPGAGNIPLSPVPEPAQALLWVAGLVLLAFAWRRRRCYEGCARQNA